MSALTFLSKKGFHVGRGDVQERVWKAEKAKEEEERRIAELRKKLEEERANQDLRTLTKGGSVDSGLEWMYSHRPKPEDVAEEYLTGQKTIGTAINSKVDADFDSDKLASQRLNAVSGVNKSSVVPEPQFTEAQLRNKEFSLRHEDPMMIMAEAERRRKEALLANPVVRERIRQKMLAEAKEAESTSSPISSRKENRREDVIRRHSSRRSRSRSPEYKSSQSKSHRRDHGDHDRSDSGHRSSRHVSRSERHQRHSSRRSRSRSDDYNQSSRSTNRENRSDRSHLVELNARDEFGRDLPSLSAEKRLRESDDERSHVKHRVSNHEHMRSSYIQGTDKRNGSSYTSTTLHPRHTDSNRSNDSNFSSSEVNGNKTQRRSPNNGNTDYEGSSLNNNSSTKFGLQLMKNYSVDDTRRSRNALGIDEETIQRRSKVMEEKRNVNTNSSSWPRGESKSSLTHLSEEERSRRLVSMMNSADSHSLAQKEIIAAANRDKEANILNYSVPNNSTVDSFSHSVMLDIGRKQLDM